MTTDRPTPDSAWATHCPDAYPEEWYDALELGSLPSGFTRFASDEEAALILGRVNPDDFARRQRVTSPPSPIGRVSRRRPNASREAVRQRFRDFSTFLRTIHPNLTPTQRTIWLAVYGFSERGRATVTQATLARIGGVTVRAVQKAMPGLIKSGLLDVLEKGRPGRSSVYRYRVP